MPAAADEIGELGEQLRETSTLLTDLVRVHTAALEAAAEADELLARISHELRTPLTAVIGFGHLIDRSRLNDEDADAIEQILRAGEHMLRIIEEGRRPVHTPQPVSLDLRAVEVRSLVQDVQSLLSSLSAGRDLTAAVKVSRIWRHPRRILGRCIYARCSLSSSLCIEVRAAWRVLAGHQDHVIVRRRAVDALGGAEARVGWR
jgi:signal transduction histidine kinase